MSDDDFDELFRAGYQPLVRALAVACGDHGLAEDVVQDAFLQALRHWERVGAYDRPEAWVRRAALNRLTDHGRRRGRRDRALRRLRTEPPATPDPDDGIDVRRGLAALTDQQRRVVGLYYLADLPVAEVADDLGLAPGTVKSHLAAARRALAPRLEVTDG